MRDPKLPEAPSALSRGILNAAGGLLFLAAVSLLGLHWYNNRQTDFDDAYMFMRYALHFLDGHGLRWNIGEPPVFGATSIPYVIQLAFSLKLLPFAPEKVLVLNSAADSLLAVVVMAFSCYENVQSRWLKSFPLILGGIAFFLTRNPQFLAHTTYGMDTMLAAASNGLMIGSVLRLRRDPSLFHAAAAGVCSWFSVFCRVDNAIYAVVFPWLVMVLFKVRLQARLVWVGVFVGLMAADAAWKAFVFGGILPLPFYVKLAGYYRDSFAPVMCTPVRNLKHFFQACLPFLGLAVFSFRGRSFRLAACFAVPLMLTVLALFQPLHIMGTMGRFFFPGLPFVVIPAVLIFDDWLRGEAGRDLKLSALSLTVGLMAALALVQWGPIALGKTSTWAAKRTQQMHAGKYDPQVVTWFKQEGIRDMDWWAAILHMDRILQKLPEDLVFAVSEDGYLSSRYPRMKIVDLNGLHDRYLARHGFDAGYVLSHKPDLIWFPHWAYPASIKAFWNEPSFWQNYDYYPRALIYGVAIRRDSPLHDKIQEAIAAEWSKVYPDTSMDAEKISGPLKINREGSPDGVAMVQGYFAKV